MESLPTHTYNWQEFSCAYRVVAAPAPKTPLLFIHPVGVGLSGHFWDRCVSFWQGLASDRPFYLPDLLGCGESAMPHVAYYPEDWAAQLQHFTATVIGRPVVLVVQGALFPVAMEWLGRSPTQIRGVILSGPPSASLVSAPTDSNWQKARWNLFDSPLGWGFYLYARQEGFLRQFSVDQLFADPKGVDAEWLQMLAKGCGNFESRHAVYSFLSGFWRRDYRPIMQQVTQSVLIVMGDQASSISRDGVAEPPAERLAFYTQTFPKATGVVIPGRNVLPYESTSAFVVAAQQFLVDQGL